MVWDNNVSQIVTLNADDTEACPLYWLPLGQAMECESFTVTLRDENFDINFAARDFLLASKDEDYEFNCCMISACYWPDSCAPIRTSFDLVNKVKAIRQLTQPPATTSANTATTNQSCCSPLIVHDLCGGFRAATFCALFTLQDLVHMESSVNVYELAKMYHLKRPGVWGTRAHISFLYEAVECLFEERHSSAQSHFRSYLNANIDAHLGNYYSNNFGNVAHSLTLSQLPSAAATTTTPSSVSGTPQAQQTVTVTLPNLNHGSGKGNQRQLASSDDIIGSRLYNFQSGMKDLKVIFVTKPRLRFQHDK